MKIHTTPATRSHGASPLLAIALAAIALVGCTKEPSEPAQLPGSPLWEGRDGADRARIEPFLPNATTGEIPAALVFPGGGYQGLAIEHEGREAARWLNSLGIAAFVVHYRHAPDSRHPAPLEDGQRAMRWVRHRASEWRISSDNVGVVGFSAGGHLASTLATHFDSGDAESPDPLERLGTRPDFALLLYSVISMTEPYAHAGSRKNLLGPEIDWEVAAELSSERQVSSESPPTFLAHEIDDPIVSSQNSVAFCEALHRLEIECELQLLEGNRHGAGMGVESTPFSAWPALAEEWIGEHVLRE